MYVTPDTTSQKSISSFTKAVFKMIAMGRRNVTYDDGSGLGKISPSTT